MSITAVVQNDTIKLPPGVHVPDGTRAEVVFETHESPPVLPGWLERSVGIATTGLRTDEIMRETRGED